MNKLNRFFLLPKNKLVVVWLKLLLNMHRLCLHVSDSVKIKGSARNPSCLHWWPPLQCTDSGADSTFGSLFPAQLPQSCLLGSPRNFCFENFKAKPCLSQPELIRGPQNVCFQRGFWREGYFKTVKRGYGQQCPWKTFAVEVLSFILWKQTFPGLLPNTVTQNI